MTYRGLGQHLNRELFAPKEFNHSTPKSEESPFLQLFRIKIANCQLLGLGVKIADWWVLKIYLIILIDFPHSCAIVRLFSFSLSNENISLVKT